MIDETMFVRIVAASFYKILFGFIKDTADNRHSKGAMEPAC
jgi:hypothetical protein